MDSDELDFEWAKSGHLMHHSIKWAEIAHLVYACTFVSDGNNREVRMLDVKKAIEASSL